MRNHRLPHFSSDLCKNDPNGFLAFRRLKSYQISCKSDYFNTSYLYSLCKSCPIYTTFALIFIGKPQGTHRRHFHIDTIKIKELFYFLTRYRVIMEQRPSRRCGGLVPRGEDSPSLCLTRFLWHFPEKGTNPGPNVAN